MNIFPALTISLGVLSLVASCGGRQKYNSRVDPTPDPHLGSPVEQDARPVIAAFGDSLSAGFGAEAGSSYPDFLQKQLDRRGYPYRVVNAGVSGDTTTGGLERLHDIVSLKPSVVILEFGANDGLRGLPVERTRANLQQMIETLKEARAEVVLAGMTLPRNYGSDYIRAFERVYVELARKYQLTLIPFLLEGVGGVTRYMQPDGMHPTAGGNEIVGATVFRYVAPLLKRKAL